ncbi:hypothetical protein RRF57_011574 [Xylaria bambusicola]|uniref:Uncharacterized protein n=1 Tax=Xylaria bambusicola TaxID=326684 RepID=A0AAN7UTY9_9PEZI
MLRFRFANSTDGPPVENGFGEPGGLWASPVGMPSLKLRANGGPRTSRILEGNDAVVGVAGRTLTEWCGDRPPARGVFVVETDPFELVELALECVW